ncbi:uncharacterized protein LOC135152192 [Daucus carota subsp. sativus]|uniref:uncharacterized protein LOC135152192 n=1 Tax=Daucus carota subsp. sativus TaxID=79200 RepID=UPI0030838D0A
MSEIPENTENPKTSEGATQGESDVPSGELTREEMKAKIKRMSRKIASLKKKSARSKKASKVTPTKLDFDGEGGRKECGNPEDGADPEMDDREHSPSKIVSFHDDEESSGSHNDNEISKKKDRPLDDDYEVALDDRDDKCKMEELLEALKKVKADKKSKAELTVKSPFTKKVRESPLPRIHRGVGDLRFNGTTDPVEYLSQFDTDMEVYQIQDLTKCRLLAATLRDDAHHWFKRLPGDSINSWRKMCELFVGQFRASVTYVPPANTLANIKQKEHETLREYFKRFNSEKELQGREPETLADFFAKAKPHKVIEESLAKLKKESKSESCSSWKNKRDRSHSPDRRNTYKRNPYVRPADEKPSSRDGKTSPITVNTTNTQGFDKSRLTMRKARETRYHEYTPLTASIYHIFEVEDKARLFRKPFRNGPPGKKDQGKYCAFHDLNGHDTAECVHLKDHIEDLIKTGYLTEFVAKRLRSIRKRKLKERITRKPTVTLELAVYG